MISLRLARPDEWSQLQLLNNEVFIDNHQYDPDLDLGWALSEQGRHYFKNLVTDSASLCLVAENEAGKLVGYLAASPKDIEYRLSKYLEIDNMGVIPEFRSQGVGQRLINECATWAKQRGYQKLFVNSFVKNEKAVAFYKRQGFSPIDISLEMSLS